MGGWGWASSSRAQVRLKSRCDECAPRCVLLLLKRGSGIELDLIIQIVYVSMQNGEVYLAAR